MWQTILGAVIVGALVVAIIVKSIIDKKKGKSSCSCGGNCGACNMCNPNASKELHDHQEVNGEEKSCQDQE